MCVQSWGPVSSGRAARERWVIKTGRTLADVRRGDAREWPMSTAAETPPAHARTSATCERMAGRGRGLRGVMEDVGEERFEKELPRGQPFDDAHGRSAARARPRRSWR